VPNKAGLMPDNCRNNNEAGKTFATYTIGAKDTQNGTNGIENGTNGTEKWHQLLIEI
jgi:hypothetical protein